MGFKLSMSFGWGLARRSNPGGGASFGFAFLRMAVVEGGSPTIVRAAITEGGPIQRLQIKDK